MLRGYIFIRENDTGVSIEDYLAPLPEHLKRYEHEKCQTVAWVAKVVPANWPWVGPTWRPCRQASGFLGSTARGICRISISPLR